MIAMNGELGVLPDGQILHAAGPAPGGWQVVAVHDSRASWDAFFESVFVPRASGAERRLERRQTTADRRGIDAEDPGGARDRVSAT